MESERQEVTLGDIEEHSKRHGRKATSQLLSILGKKQPLYDIVMSKGGQMLFKNIIDQLNMLLDLIVDNKATDVEIMEYKVNADFLNHSAAILSNYKKLSNKLKGV